MLILPLEKSIDWKRPPWVTFGLIAINVIVFGMTQDIDDRRIQRALDYYLVSPLPAIELPFYIEHLQQRGEAHTSRRLKQLVDKKSPNPMEKTLLGQLILSMNYDEAFIVPLRNNQIVTPQHPQFNPWREARMAYEGLLGQTVIHRYGFTPEQHQGITLVSHMFLHANLGHLIGNMAFLFLLGFAVETALGSVRYLACYLATGLGGVGLFWLGHQDSVTPLVGASGAIAGVMGLYAGIFGLRKIRFFYSILFYFDYVRAPALIMLPLWLAHEYYQLASSETSNVAYLAHIGGLLSGGGLAWLLNSLFPKDIDRAYLDAADKQNWRDQRYQEALAQLGDLQIDKARQLLAELHRDYPEDREILLLYYKTLKYRPQAPEYHSVTAKVLALPGSDQATLKTLRATFTDYWKNPAGIKLPPALLLSLALRLCKAGYAGEAESVAALLLKARPGLERLDELLMALACAFAKQGDKGKGRAYLHLIHSSFPQGQTAIQARRMLDGKT